VKVARGEGSLYSRKRIAGENWQRGRELVQRGLFNRKEARSSLPGNMRSKEGGIPLVISSLTCQRKLMQKRPFFPRGKRGIVAVRFTEERKGGMSPRKF